MSKETRAVTSDSNDDYVYKENGILRGICIDLWEQIANNLSVTNYRPKEIHYRDLSKALGNNTADIVIQRMDRGRMERAQIPEEVYKISTSIAMGGTRAVMLYADEKVDLLIFFKPFTWPTWVTFFGLWFLYAVVLTAISLLSKRGADFSPTRPREDFTFLQSLSYFSVASLQLGPDKQPVSIGGKFLRQWWSFFCLIFVATYTANLAAIFSETSPSKPIKSIDNIIDFDFNISAFKTYESDFVEANNKILNELMRNNRIQFINMTEKGWSSAIKKALQSGHIWLDYDAHMEWFKKMNEDLTMYTLDGYFSVFSYGFAMRRNWTHLVQVRKLIRKFSGEGVIDQIKRKYQVSRDEKKGIRSLQFTSFVGVFCFVFSAAIVGLLLSLIDFLLQKRKIRRDELLIPRIRHTQF